MKPLGKTAEALVDTFTQLVMAHGFNAVSYADLAKRLGIRTASIHYHFPTKGDLGMAVLQRYGHTALQTFDAMVPGDAQSYHNVFETMLSSVRSVAKMDATSCLVGVLGAEYASLPDTMKTGVHDFFEQQQAMLTRLLGEGREAGAFAFSGNPEAMAKLVASTLQGAILIKKARNDPTYINSILDSLHEMVIPAT